MKESVGESLLYVMNHCFRPNALRAKMNKLVNNTRGWILVDSLMGVTILVTALLAIMVLYTQITSSTVAARDYQNATYIAQQQLDNLRQYDGTATLNACPPIAANPASQTIENVSYTIALNEKANITLTESLHAKVCPYQVSVSWDDPKKPGTPRLIQVVNYYYSN